MYLWTALILGFGGSLHCAGMCGPLALALPPTGRTRLGYLAGRVAYNGGRLLTYAGLGLVFGLAGKTFLLAGVQQWVSLGLGIALLGGLLLSHRLSLWRPVNRLVDLLKSGMSSLLRRRSVAALGVLGLFNGLLPCGLVYVACAGAVTTGHVFSSIQYMLVFGLGTVPMMLGIGLGGRLVPLAVRLRLRGAVPVAVGLIGVMLILRGLSLGIPYLSPDLSGSHAACCGLDPSGETPSLVDPASDIP